MNKTVKLNGPIRSLYKSKAKEAIEASGKSKATPLIKERDAILKTVVAYPVVKKLVSKWIVTHAEADRIATELYKMGIAVNSGTNPSFAYKITDKSRFSAENIKYKKLDKQIDELSACRCHTGDSPELLEFAANLSLCKTVGEADALLAKL